jgi:hypothetical protein
MIQLTEQQHEAIDQAVDDPVRAIDPTTKKEYVLLPAGAYERLKAIFADGDAWTAHGYAAAMEVFAREGWDDPRMDVYDADQRQQSR